MRRPPRPPILLLIVLTTLLASSSAFAVTATARYLHTFPAEVKGMDDNDPTHRFQFNRFGLRFDLGTAATGESAGLDVAVDAHLWHYLREQERSRGSWDRSGKVQLGLGIPFTHHGPLPWGLNGALQLTPVLGLITDTDGAEQNPAHILRLEGAAWLSGAMGGTMSWTLGVAYDHDFGEAALQPLVGFTRRGADFRTRLLLPKYFEALQIVGRYSGDRRLWAGVAAEVEGGRYGSVHLPPKPLEQPELRYSELRAGPRFSLDNVDFRVTFDLGVSAGIRQLTLDAGSEPVYFSLFGALLEIDPVSELDLDPAFFLSLTLEPIPR